MRIRYHFEQSLNEFQFRDCYECNTCSFCRLKMNGISLFSPLISEFAKKGLIILESEPQVRSILTILNNKYIVKVPFPYIYFCFSYIKVADEYYYDGLLGYGLTIYASNHKLKSTNDSLYLLPIESDRGGVVCTSHSHDGKKYDNLSLLINDIVGLWWNTPQRMESNLGFESKNTIRNFNQWSEYSLENFLKEIPVNQFRFERIFNINRISEKINFIDEPFISNKQINLNHDFIDKLKPILMAIKTIKIRFNRKIDNNEN